MNKLSINPISFIYFNIYNLEYERSFQEGKAGLSIFYGNSGSEPRIIAGSILNVKELDISLKKYANTFCSSSFWYGGRISVSLSDLQESKIDDFSSNLGTLGVMAKEGYQLIFKFLYVDFNIGIGIIITNNLFGNANYSENYFKKRWIVNWGIRTGFVF